MGIFPGGLSFSMKDSGQTARRSIQAKLDSVNVSRRRLDHRAFDKDTILELAKKYLKSERYVMAYHPLERLCVWESGGTRRVVNGFWR